MLIDNPPPPRVFKLASVSFGLLAEILLLKWVSQLLCNITLNAPSEQLELEEHKLI